MKITDDMLTEWFPAKVKPVHVGWYQRDYEDDFTNIPDYWDGCHWIIGDEDGILKGRAQSKRPWRGLKEKHHD